VGEIDTLVSDPKLLKFDKMGKKKITNIIDDQGPITYL